MFKRIFNYRFDLIWIRIYKILRFLTFPNLWLIVLKGVVPGFEHIKAIKKIKNVKKINTLVDCGSNKGQFGIILFSIFNYKKYISFDPIIKPLVFNEYLNNKRVSSLHNQVALSNISSSKPFFLTTREDSSSLKKTIKNSKLYFADVDYNKTINVNVKTLDSYESLIKNSPSPRIIKIDVQGSELDLINGASKTLKYFEYIFIEISFKQIYLDVGNPKDIFFKLSEKGFQEMYSYNSLKRKGKLISKDFVFKKIH